MRVLSAHCKLVYGRRVSCFGSWPTKSSANDMLRDGYHVATEFLNLHFFGGGGAEKLTSPSLLALRCIGLEGTAESEEAVKAEGP